MSDLETQESGQAGEQGELPTPSFSGKGDSSTSDADVLVSKLFAQLEPLIEKKVQSTKDKRISEIEKVLGGRSKILAELESEGVTIPKEVRAELRMRELEEMLTKPAQQPAQERVDGSTQQKAATTDAIAELQKYGLSTNDADFLTLLRGNYQNRAEFDLAVQKHVVGKLAPQKQPNPADVVQSPATATAAVTDTSAKIARLAELQKQPTKYKAEINQLVAELEKAGWQ